MSLATPSAQRFDAAAARDALVHAQRTLLAQRTDGHWCGRLSSSALSTATALIALAALEKLDSGRQAQCAALVERGLRWLTEHQNGDGGWGDTLASPSNISTTMLGWAAYTIAGRADAAPAAGAERWIEHAVGSREPASIAAAVAAVYGKDRTFSAPILLASALAGRLGADGWRFVPQLPFEIAACPRQWFKRLRLPVVSYALPALIAIGHARHRRRPSANPIARGVRSAVTRRTLDVLRQIQPASGGFLEAIPLTAFVTMSLVAGGLPQHPVVDLGAAFLARSIRPDGSWPIDTTLATWVTTLAVNGLGRDGVDAVLSPEERGALLEWLLGQQHRVVHPYTQAAPGGWAWTDLSGGVPDADDTAGALVALSRLGPADDRIRTAARAGVLWLLRLQNADGGIPTFCRGWTNLPFDRSGPDLTAHALRAWAAWRDDCDDLRDEILRAARRALRYLARVQRPDGAWTPLWFGNQSAPLQENPTYGTARVLVALHESAPILDPTLSGAIAAAGTKWLLAAQNADRGWGGAAGTPSSIEETALAVSALAAGPQHAAATLAVDRGVAWLVEATNGGRVFAETPIGLYFAKLWYSEELYPVVFTVSALGGALAAVR